ncbi:DMT family transporter [Thiohalomonas denitrificans]|uniref:EamA domain-containing membrane protein RarD n=1 Tax=Thiohalomonas denitrificans TaxID=415747 RepID=A0A1G5QUA8_9GAMM|nr:DMT family transporter [Thiohalomonas denitrificans]SCZ64659.1 EamA domain-containing membrane protein RarD [Thiohalomonas denitrificans]
MHPVLPVFVLISSAILWGVTWWPLQYFHTNGVAGIPLILVGYGVVGLVLLPWLIRERRAWRGESRFLWIMLLLGGWANLSFASAMIYGEVVRAMMLFYLAPVWGVLGGWLFLGETIDRARWFGVGLALLGAFLVLGGPVVFETAPSWLDLLAISSGLAFALNNVTCRGAAHVPLMSKTAAMFIGCGLMAIVALPLVSAGLPEVPGTTWFWLVMFGLVWLLIATLGTLWAVTHMEAGRASVLLITELLAAVISAVVIGGETLSAGELAGGALILAATLIEARRGPDEPVVDVPAAY